MPNARTPPNPGEEIFVFNPAIVAVMSIVFVSTLMLAIHGYLNPLNAIASRPIPVIPLLLAVMLGFGLLLVQRGDRVHVSSAGIIRSGGVSDAFSLRWDEIRSVKIHHRWGTSRPDIALIDSTQGVKSLPLRMWIRQGQSLADGWRQWQGLTEPPPLLDCLRGYQIEIGVADRRTIEVTELNPAFPESRFAVLLAIPAVLLLMLFLSPDAIATRNVAHPLFALWVTGLFMAGVLMSWTYLRRQEPRLAARLAACCCGVFWP